MESLLWFATVQIHQQINLGSRITESSLFNCTLKRSFECGAIFSLFVQIFWITFWSTSGIRDSEMTSDVACCFPTKRQLRRVYITTGFWNRCMRLSSAQPSMLRLRRRVLQFAVSEQPLRLSVPLLQIRRAIKKKKLTNYITSKFHYFYVRKKRQTLFFNSSYFLTKFLEKILQCW